MSSPPARQAATSGERDLPPRRAPGVGLEPTTSRLTVERVCQLSYPGMGHPGRSATPASTSAGQLDHTSTPRAPRRNGACTHAKPPGTVCEARHRGRADGRTRPANDQTGRFPRDPPVVRSSVRPACIVRRSRSSFQWRQPHSPRIRNSRREERWRPSRIQFWVKSRCPPSCRAYRKRRARLNGWGAVSGRTRTRCSRARWAIRGRI